MKKNRSFKILLAVAACVGSAFCSRTVRASSVWDFSFSSVSGPIYSGSGTLTLEENATSPSYPDHTTFTATAGSIKLPDPNVIGSTTSGYTGTFNLYDAAHTVGASVYQADNGLDGATFYYSQSGFFYFDNQLYFGDASTNKVGGMLLDVGGLVFSHAPVSPGGPLQEINLYQSGNYVYYENNGVNTQINFQIAPHVGAAPVPLPEAAGVGICLLGGAGVFQVARRRLARANRIA